MKNNDPFINAPEKTPIYLMGSNNRLYIGTIVKINGEWYRDECLKGDPDEFYRTTIIAWAYINE